MVQFYTLEEVKLRNGKNGAQTWIVIHDCVYDATEFLEEHPGGGELITDVAGSDCTKEFDDFGHSSDAKKLLVKYKIGELVEQDKRVNRIKNNAKEVEKLNGDGVEIDGIKRRRKFRFFFCA